jgi:hypothetical protein
MVCRGKYSFVSPSYSLRAIAETDVEARVSFGDISFRISEEK